MPKQITEIKEFLNILRRTDAKSVQIKKSTQQTKFKVRTAKYLLTLVVKDKQKAAKVEATLPPSVEVKVL